MVATSQCLGVYFTELASSWKFLTLKRVSFTCAEYIVTFIGYYSTEARDGFITAALRPFSGWSIIPRANPSQSYPSDFSLVQLKTGVTAALKSLQDHPSVKRVSPQKKLTRMLTFSDEGE